jgi:mono/diheme cytochrome c family protein
MVLNQVTATALMLAALAAAGATAQAQASDRQIVRGRYLVENVGMCGDCHTPRGAMGQPDLQRPMAGTALDFRPTISVPDWAESAPAIAGPQARGWTRAQMVDFLKTGARPDGSMARPPMPMIRFTADDAEAVAAYLASLPAPVAAVKPKVGAR